MTPEGGKRSITLVAEIVTRSVSEDTHRVRQRPLAYASGYLWDSVVSVGPKTQRTSMLMPKNDPNAKARFIALLPVYSIRTPAASFTSRAPMACTSTRTRLGVTKRRRKLGLCLTAMGIRVTASRARRRIRATGIPIAIGPSTQAAIVSGGTGVVPAVGTGTTRLGTGNLESQVVGLV